MTTPRYLVTSCSAGSQERGLMLPPAAASPADCAWIVNFNNGNSDWNNRNNRNRVRAVRSVSRASECQDGSVTFRALFAAWRRARQHKVPSNNQLEFETFWIDRLQELEQAIAAGTWSPRPTTCFIATRPKAREIHAPDFSDRVVHHWLVPQLEALWEPRFIHDSYANRVGKGTHAAVHRLRQFVRQVASGQGGGWYLQLDIRNFFNSIHRPTLYGMLKRVLEEKQVHIDARRTVHALLRQSIHHQGVMHCSSAAERARVPAHKRLENAAPHCGLPIGNLSSQFFANVYLDALDRFAKHTLRAQRYLRYVDDFVFVHRDRAQLEAWLDQVTTFIREQLHLELKPDIRLRALSAGIDFLGYVVYPTHTRIRRRVVRHAFQAVKSAANPRDVLASYLGHFAHANARALADRLAATALSGNPRKTLSGETT
jgi:RNA-directed DNA polymerase